MKDGASDFLTKPVDTDHLLLLLDRAVEKRRLLTELVLLKDDYQQRFGLPRVLGEDAAFKDARSYARWQFSYQIVGGGTLKGAELAGAPVAVWFWAPW